MVVLRQVSHVKALSSLVGETISNVVLFSSSPQINLKNKYMLLSLGPSYYSWPPSAKIDLHSSLIVDLSSIVKAGLDRIQICIIQRSLSHHTVVPSTQLAILKQKPTSFPEEVSMFPHVPSSRNDLYSCQNLPPVSVRVLLYASACLNSHKEITVR